MPRCVAACTPPTTRCGKSCVDLRSDILHCGGCGSECPRPPNASATCEDGVCGYRCVAPYADCNGSASDGCEESLRTLAHCGACGASCAFPHAVASCATGDCELTACVEGFGDCDGSPGNGCESDLGTLEHCGACGRACAPAHATGACSGGTCAIAACDPGFADCDGLVENGCEADLGSPGTCGACDRRCAVGERCETGTCLRPTAVVEVGAGKDFSCAMLADGRVFCWGNNASGQLGNGMMMNSSRAVAVVGIDDAIDLAVGGSHACVVRRGGQVFCWGENGRGQLGDGTNTDRSSPVRAGTIADAVGVSAGEDFTCAVRRTGQVECWGSNDQGQLGDGTTVSRGTAMLVSSLPAVIGVSAGTDHVCAWTVSGALYCWGSNGQGRLGDGTTIQQRTPIEITGAGGVRHVAAGWPTRVRRVRAAARRAGARTAWVRSAMARRRTDRLRPR